MFHFINEGTISAAGQGAVSLAHATITNFTNKGLIKGKKDGIAFFNAGGKLQTTITNLEIEKGIVKGGENGINLSRIEFDRRNNNGQGEKNDRIVQNLTIKEGAALSL